MLCLSIVVTYIFTINELSITKTKATFNCNVKNTVYVVDILFMPGNFFLTTVGNFFSTFEANLLHYP